LLRVFSACSAVLPLSVQVAQYFIRAVRPAGRVLSVLYSLGREDWPNTYRQPDGVRTYVSLNHNLYSNGFPWSIPLAHRRAVTTAVSAQIRTVWLESSCRSYVTVPALASSSRAAFVYMRPLPVPSTKSSARMRSITPPSPFRPSASYSLSS